MIKRVITGAGFAVLIVACVWFQGWAMRALLGAFMLISTHEMYKALANAGMKPVRWPGYAFCLLSLGAHVLESHASASLHAPLMALVAALMIGMSAIVLRGRIDFPGMVSTILPMVYPGAFYIVLLGLLNLQNRAVITVALALAFFAASINDVFALFSGMLFGKHKLSPEISPKKTIEGSIGGMLFCVLFCMAVPALVGWLLSHDPASAGQLALLPPVWSFALLGLVAGAFSQIGDLTASLVKRHCGIKDFGNLLPGHGGIMDRMDGVLFCGAAVAIFFRLLGLG